MQYQKDGGARDERRLSQPRQGLGLAMPETVFLVGGHQRVAHGEKIDQRCANVHDRVDEGSQDADGTGGEPGGRFCNDEHRRRGDGCVGRKAQ